MFGDNAGALTLAMITEHGTSGHRVGMAGKRRAGSEVVIKLA